MYAWAAHQCAAVSRARKAREALVRDLPALLSSDDNDDVVVDLGGTRQGIHAPAGVVCVQQLRGLQQRVTREMAMREYVCVCVCVCVFTRAYVCIVSNA